MISLPDTFEKKMKDLLGDEYPAYLRCYDEPRYYGLRVNTAKISAAEFQKIAPWPLKKVPWISNGFYYDGDRYAPAKHPYYAAGLYYLQEPSAMTPADRLPVFPGERVLDLCAAPGGKATELASRLQGSGVLVANDISSSRAKGLLKNLELFGTKNMLVVSEEPGKLAGYFPAYFDKILIDAPCSGEGMFRKDRKMVKAWEEHGPEYFSRLQRSIILQAASMLRPGGMLLYSTCTFDPLENEQTIEYLLEHCPEFTICEMDGYSGFCTGRPEYTKEHREDLKKTVRIFPHKMQGEGHYLALLKKSESDIAAEDEQKAKRRGSGNELRTRKKIPEELEAFLQEITWEIDQGRLDFREDRVYYMPEDLPDLSGIHFLRSGLLLGELKKNRFEPSQALAMCLKKEEYPRILDFSASDIRVIRYLRGETLDVEDIVHPKEKGWYLICVDGFPLGFGKLANQTIKNKYLPGWRWIS